MTFNRLDRIALLLSIFLIIFILSTEISLACGIRTVWGEAGCEEVPLKYQQSWVWGGPVCFIKPHSGFYSWGIEEVNPSSRYDRFQKACQRYTDKAWYFGEVGHWPNGGEEGDECKVYWDTPFAWCNAYWEGVWDSEENACVICDGVFEVKRHDCSRGAFPTERKCEQACDASETCDEHFPAKVDPRDIVGFDQSDQGGHRARKCNDNCQPYTISQCTGDWECEPGYKCCITTGKCLSPPEYCGEPGLKEECVKNPTCYRDICNGTCEYDVPPTKNYQCKSTDGCSGDPRCDGVRPLDEKVYCGQVDGKAAYCTKNCKCSPYDCEDDNDCAEPRPKCCKATKTCVARDKYCGEPGTENGKYCCNGNCEYGNTYVISKTGGPQCTCTDTNCQNGFCVNNNNCYYSIGCRDDGKWIGDLDDTPSCPTKTDPCQMLLDLTVSSWGKKCTQDGYEPVVDVVRDDVSNIKDTTVNSRDIAVIARHFYEKDWCTNRLENELTNPCTRVAATYKYWCYYNGRKTCDRLEGWQCEYSTENCPFGSGCGLRYYGQYKMCYFDIQCADKKPEGFGSLSGSSRWFARSGSTAAHCSGNTLNSDGTCTSKGPVFRSIYDCDLLDGTSEAAGQGHKVVDYQCSVQGDIPMCVEKDVLYAKQATLYVWEDGTGWISEDGATPSGPCIDINNDSKINILDITYVAKAFGTNSGEPRYREDCDFDINGKINILDITMVARKFGKPYSCD